MKPESITLYCQQGRSDKVYKIWLEPDPETSPLTGITTGFWRVRAAYGRRGSPLKEIIKTSRVGHGSALYAYTNLLEEKLRKGYRAEGDRLYLRNGRFTSTLVTSGATSQRVNLSPPPVSAPPRRPVPPPQPKTSPRAAVLSNERVISFDDE